MLICVQSQEEILANKVVAFPASVATRNRPHYRDIWDMHWLAGNGTALCADLVRAKMMDHRADPAWMKAATTKAARIVQSADFTTEMRRFLLPDTAKATLDNERYMEFLANETARLIREADQCLKEIDPSIEEKTSEMLFPK